MKKEFEKRFLSSIILVPLSFFVIIKGSILFNLFLIICLLVAFYEWHMMARQKKFLIPGYFFLILSFYCTYNLRNHLDSDGLATFLFVIIICISTDIGGYLFGKLNNLVDKYPCVKEVRGRGLMVGIVLDREAAVLLPEMLKQGVIALTAGENVLRLLPPLNVTAVEIDTAVNAIEAALKAVC